MPQFQDILKSVTKVIVKSVITLSGILGFSTFGVGFVAWLFGDPFGRFLLLYIALPMFVVFLVFSGIFGKMEKSKKGW